MAPQYAYPDADHTDGLWTNESGGAVLYTSIDDVQGAADGATTFIKATDVGSSVIGIVQLSDVSAPGSAGTYIKYAALTQDNQFTGNPPDLKLEILQGGLVVTPAITTTNIAVSTASFTDYSFEVTDVSGISDWTDLQIRFTMVPGDGAAMLADDLMKVTQVYLETQAASVVGSGAHPTRKFVKISSYLPTKSCTLSPVFGV